MADSLPIWLLQNLFHTTMHQEANIGYMFPQKLFDFFLWHCVQRSMLLHMSNEQYNQDNQYNATYQRTFLRLPLPLLPVVINNDTMVKVFLLPCALRSGNRSYRR